MRRPALGLGPAVGAAGAVGGVEALGDDALEAELARRGEQRGAVRLEMLDDADHRLARAPLGQDGGEPRLALAQRHLAQVGAVGVQQVEGEEHQRVGLAGGDRRLQRGEVGPPLAVERDDLAVVEPVGQRRRRCHDGAELPAPVEPAPGAQHRLLALDADLHAVAVELDLVDPLGSGRRLVDASAELRRDELGDGLVIPGRRSRTRKRCASPFPGLARLAASGFACGSPERRRSLLGARRRQLRLRRGSGGRRLRLVATRCASLLLRQPLVRVPDGIGSRRLVHPQHEGLGCLALAFRDRRHGAARGHRCVDGEHAAALVGVDRLVVAMLDEQPVRPFAAELVAFHAHQHEAALEPLAGQHELQLAVGERLFRRLVLLRRPEAAVEQLHRAAAVLPLGDGALEVAVAQRMVLDLDRQALVARVERRPLGHRPGLEDPVEFEPQVEVQPRRVVLLHHETQLVRGQHAVGAARLGRLLEVALGLVAAEVCGFGHALRTSPTIHVAVRQHDGGHTPLRSDLRFLRRDAARVTITRVLGVK